MLHVHRAERADRLADALAEILADPPDDPFTPEVVSVATRGMERWLVQRLSGRLGARPERRDGVCANVEFPFPGRLIGGALAVASGIDPDADPWTADRLVWPLLEVIEAHETTAWLAPLRDHLASAPDRRFARVRRIAHLFAEYGVQRPAMLQAWARGEEDRGGGWQAELWRCLRDRVGVPSAAERLPEACARLRSEPDLVELPARFCLFGLTRLPPSYLEALQALAAARAAHLLLLHPSPVLWERVRASVVERGHAGTRRSDPTASLPVNRLLASWSRDSRELQLVIAGSDAVDHHLPLSGEEAGTLLARLQADIRADRAAPGVPLPGAPDERMVLSSDDDSIRVHACHGRPRQVEVLREAILHLLAGDPTLEPRDVIVMCPDIEAFAPLIQAAFGSGPAAAAEAAAESGKVAEGSRIDLRVRLADRSLRQTNPVLGVLARLLELPAQRLTASQVLDLADAGPVRRRFGFDDDELARLADWVSASAIHWGLDAAHRAQYKLEAVEAGTWRAGLRRVLLGVTLSESGQRLFERVLPVDDVDSGSIGLAGRFAEFLDRLGVAVELLSGRRPLREWAYGLRRAADGLTATPDWDAWQRLELERILEAVESEAQAGSGTPELALPEIRALLSDRLAGRPTRANFRTGHLTVCTLVPMRSVPHRVVCLLGLDDGAFPRHQPRDGDNRLLDEPQVGDRDPRAEDRQLLLDAFLAARERLLITYSGHDERTNVGLPPAVPVAELLDAVEATAQGNARQSVVVEHPLQPFDRRNFLPGRLVADEAWSFDPVALEGARALEGQRSEPSPFLAGPLPPAVGSTLALSDLIGFVQRPVRAFLRQRLGITVISHEDEVQDALPVELDGLARWQIGQRLLDGLLAGIEPARCVAAEFARGELPPGELARPIMRSIRDQVHPILRAARSLAPGEAARSLEANLLLASESGPSQLTGTVTGVRDHVLLTASFSRLNPRLRLGAWVNLLVLSAAHPDIPFEAVTVGRASGQDGGAAVARIRSLGPNAEQRRAQALRELAALVDLRRRGLREPLPVPCQTAAAYATARWGGRADVDSAVRLAAGEWESGFDRPRENRDPEHRLVFGDELTMDELTGLAPASDEQGAGWPAEESSRFGRFAVRLWAPVLARETLE
ncbi:MAG TPA: exodeoxyribonuclease V subunit gamma [Solirubrobacteraceae bacterium]|nr:exodeoxyribonuclease V subunit gamma [Solirubrobacteraceae bacterium]